MMASNCYRHRYLCKSGNVTNISLLLFPIYWTQANSADPYQTLDNEVSDQDRNCLLTKCSIKIWEKNEKYHPAPLKLEIGSSY